ncbi:alpha/beta hydrolase [Ostreiculturibacter nitratireducens]|uniref:alpha/beta fold hydrolase n=1 Tax=Ostreiculturibacter nitratireducens TaxID=3075226 RepID=UPI0031B5923B
MTAVTLDANGLTFDTESFGDPSGEAMLLLCGLGSQRISWSSGFVEALTLRGFRVVTMDNRDAGLSTKLKHLGVPDLRRLRSAATLGPSDVPYTVLDMADDVAGVLDALGLENAHIVGRSMGGLVAQALAARYPERVTSVSLLVSTSAASELWPLPPNIEDLLFSAGPSGTPVDRDALLDASVETDRLYASPAYPFDVAERRALAAACFDRCYDPAGAARQSAALLHAFLGDAFPVQVRRPALVVQGMDDTIFPPLHGRDLARRIRGARLLEVPGMGHDLEGDAVRIVTEAVVELARSRLES